MGFKREQAGLAGAGKIYACIWRKHDLRINHLEIFHSDNRPVGGGDVLIRWEEKKAF